MLRSPSVLTEPTGGRIYQEEPSEEDEFSFPGSDEVSTAADPVTSDTESSFATLDNFQLRLQFIACVLTSFAATSASNSSPPRPISAA